MTTTTNLGETDQCLNNNNNSTLLALQTIPKRDPVNMELVPRKRDNFLEVKVKPPAVQRVRMRQGTYILNTINPPQQNNFFDEHSN